MRSNRAGDARNHAGKPSKIKGFRRFFIFGMLPAVSEVSDGATDKAAMRWKQIERLLATHPYIMNADVRALCGVSAATANRILAGLAAEGKLVKCREGGHWAYSMKIKENHHEY